MKRYNIAFFMYEKFVWSIDVTAFDEVDAVVQAEEHDCSPKNEPGNDQWTRIIITKL